MGRSKRTLPNRDTRQRRAILRVLTEAGGPLTPAEICRRARKLVPGLGLATVYRNLRNLTETGTLRTVEFPGAGRRFELAADHHHHFLCRVCDRAFCTRLCRGTLARWVPRGFVVESHEVTLFGVCNECSGRWVSLRRSGGRRSVGS